MKINNQSVKKLIIISTVAVCILYAFLLVICGFEDEKVHVDSFSENIYKLEDGWTITDSDGNTEVVSFPYTLSYGKDGKYTLKHIFVEDMDMISSPAFQFYSNYLDVKIILDGETIYRFPKEEPLFTDATGNTLHYARIDNYYGKTIEIELNCQLGDSITYELRTPRIGAKATMLIECFRQSLAFLIVSASMVIISIFLFILNIILKKQNRAKSKSLSIWLPLFTLLFAFYAFFVSPYAQMAISNSIAIYVGDLSALMLMPIPLIMLFAEKLNDNHKWVCYTMVFMCLINFFFQFVLYLTSVASFRTFLTLTQILLLIFIFTAYIMLIVNKGKNRDVTLMIVSSTPMLVGGIVDIILIWTKSTFISTSIFFMIGVLCFILFQFVMFLIEYFKVLKIGVENSILKRIAYKDLLSGFMNRNAYEIYVNKLSHLEDKSNIGCILGDVNKLKAINDVYGHQTGDLVIKSFGEVARKCVQDRGKCFRIGGDEFVFLFDNITNEDICKVRQNMIDGNIKMSTDLKLSYSISLGCGVYEETDKDIINFLKRMDNLMYEEKAKRK